MNVGVLGGAFDPPHYGHQHAVEVALRSGCIETVWAVPSGERDDKGYSTPSNHRRALAKLFVELVSSTHDDRTQLNEIEFVGQRRTNGTVELFELLKITYPRDEFFLIVGSDLIPQIPSWRHVERLQKEVRFLAIAREETRAVIDEKFQISWLVSEENMNISSTEIRRRVKAGDSIKGMTFPEIEGYIFENRLYFS